jgi:hypothetical protein
VWTGRRMWIGWTMNRHRSCRCRFSAGVSGAMVGKRRGSGRTRRCVDDRAATSELGKGQRMREERTIGSEHDDTHANVGRVRAEHIHRVVVLRQKTLGVVARPRSGSGISIVQSTSDWLGARGRLRLRLRLTVVRRLSGSEHWELRHISTDPHCTGTGGSNRSHPQVVFAPRLTSEDPPKA